MGVPFGPSKRDQCGECDGDDLCLDCQGTPNGPVTVDQCGECGGTNECLGCDEVPDSGLEFDICDVCGGDGSSCQGCDGVPHSGLVLDHCGLCGGDDSACCGPEGFCSGHGECDRTLQACSCDTGWTGSLCNQRQDLCRGQDCNSRGDCSADTGICQCTEAWTGPSCEYKTCGPRNGFYHPAREECVCREGYGGEDCTECAQAPGDHVYICLQKNHPSQSDYLEFMLYAIHERELGRYLEGNTPLTSSRKAILPDTDHEEMHYGCDCKAAIIILAAAAVEQRDTTTTTIVITIEGMLEILLTEGAETIQPFMATQMYECSQENLEAAEFEAGFFAAFYPVLFAILFLLFVCVILALFLLAPARRQQSP